MGKEIHDYNIKSEQAQFNKLRPKDHQYDPCLKTGIVERIVFDESTNDYMYAVRVNDLISRGGHAVLCRPLYRFNSIMNQEFFALSDLGDERDDVPLTFNPFYITPGDSVVVAYLNGIKSGSNNGVILGSFSSSRAKKTWVEEADVVYYSSYAGLNQVIKDSGEYSITFNGTPKNINDLRSISDEEVKKVYDPEIAGTHLKFIGDGSFEINDNKLDGKNSVLKIDKGSSLVSITSSVKNSLNIDGLNKRVSLAATTISLSTLNQSENDKIELKSSTIKADASKEIVIKAPKVAIGTSEAELLDLIEKLIDALSEIQVITPMGPAQPLKQDLLGSWPSKIEDIKSKISSIKGKIS